MRVALGNIHSSAGAIDHAPLSGVYRELGDVASERTRVATESVGARLLDLQADDGRWGGAAWNRGWDPTMHVLMLLRDLGLDPAATRHPGR
ncbi:MAG TPA: hypothetical protein VIX19_14530 [Terriglobales bacterium]